MELTEVQEQVIAELEQHGTPALAWLAVHAKDAWESGESHKLDSYTELSVPAKLLKKFNRANREAESR